MLIVSAGETNIGRRRAVNEDALLTTHDLFAVADGMGGHAAGDVASATAVEVLRLLSGSALTPEDVASALVAANEAILDSASAHPEQRGMGTTVAGLGVVQLSGGAHWLVFNVGDSRVYRYAEGTLHQLTVDHSEVAEMVAAGEIDAGAARSHPRRNVVTRCLGTSPFPDPDMWVFPPQPGERFVVCSDGLTVELADDAIVEILDRYIDPATAATALVERALTAGGRDNVTVIVVNHLLAEGRNPIDENTAPRARQFGGS